MTPWRHKRIRSTALLFHHWR